MPQAFSGSFGPTRWLTGHLTPTQDQKKAMLSQQFNHAITQLNNKYSGKLTPQQLQKAQLAWHMNKSSTSLVPGSGMSVGAGGASPMDGSSPQGLMRPAAGGSMRM